MSSFPSFILDVFANNVELFVGYAICVLFPIPWINRFIIDLWAKMLASKPSTN